MPAAARRTAGKVATTAAAPAADAGAAAISLLKDEHLAIASVLYSLRAAVRRIRAGREPDFRLLRALLNYIVAFPERLHHPKEDRFLFTALVTRHPQAAPLIATLEAEHAEGAVLIAALVDTLVSYAAAGAASFDEFAHAVETYVDFHWRHMATEEDVVLPLARRHLTVEDWGRIAAAFRDNDNPLSGIKPRDEAEALFRQILALVPDASSPASPRRRGP